jgi:hypothetical protein
MQAIAILFALAAQTIPFSLDRLELNLAVDYEHERIDGVARLTVRNVSSQPAGTVPFLLGRLMTVKSAGALKFEQTIATFNDEPKRQVDAVTIHLPKALAPGDTTTVAIDYGGYIVGYVETGNLYVKDTVSKDFSIIRNDAYAFPVLGVPSRAVNRRIRRDDFTFDARITVPTGFTVAAGALVDTKDVDGKTTFHFGSSVPVPFVNFPIAKFGTLDEGGVRVYYLPEDEAGAKLVMQRTREALGRMTKWFGPLRLAPKVTIIEIPDMWGSQAALIPGIILTADSFRDPKYLVALYHELAHLWNPNALERPPARLNEGQSMWMQWVLAEEVDRMPPDMMAKVVRRAIDRLKDERLGTVPLAEFGAHDMTDYSYNVGMLYFLALEKAIGRDAVLGVLGDFYQTSPDGATLKDFTSLIEKRYPQAAAIDAEWIYSTRWRESLARP